MSSTRPANYRDIARMTGIPDKQLRPDALRDLPVPSSFLPSWPRELRSVWTEPKRKRKYRGRGRSQRACSETRNKPRGK